MTTTMLKLNARAVQVQKHLVQIETNFIKQSRMIYNRYNTKVLLLFISFDVRNLVSHNFFQYLVNEKSPLSLCCIFSLKGFITGSTTNGTGSTAQSDCGQFLNICNWVPLTAVECQCDPPWNLGTSLDTKSRELLVFRAFLNTWALR